MAEIQFSHFTLPPPKLPSWPWQAMMITCINCYLLWSLAWLLFLINLSVFSYSGKHLWFYTTVVEPFGFTIPESFIFLSVVLSLFAAGAVVFGTCSTPKLWKRVVMVSIFSAIAVGTSYLSLHLRHFSYAAAVSNRDRIFERYHLNLVSDSSEDWRADALVWDKQILDRYDEQIEVYEEMFEGSK